MKLINMRKFIVVKIGPKKMIWLFLVPFSFLEVVPSGTTHGYFHLVVL